MNEGCNVIIDKQTVKRVVLNSFVSLVRFKYLLLWKLILFSYSNK